MIRKSSTTDSKMPPHKNEHVHKQFRLEQQGDNRKTTWFCKHCPAKGASNISRQKAHLARCKPYLSSQNGRTLTSPTIPERGRVMVLAAQQKRELDKEFALANYMNGKSLLVVEW